MNVYPAERPKVTLSEAELQLVSNAGFILTKNSIIEKVYSLFGHLASEYEVMFSQLKQQWPEAFAGGAKIARGEKYEHLPWVMLDYPRCFSPERGHFAIRTFFWWGNFFSIRLQVSGKYRAHFEQRIRDSFFSANEWYHGYTNNPWNHQLPNPEWADLIELIPENEKNANHYLVIAKKIEVSQWDMAENFLLNSCRLMIEMLENN
jgi:hypothetical protein